MRIHGGAGATRTIDFAPLAPGAAAPWHASVGDHQALPGGPQQPRKVSVCPGGLGQHSNKPGSTLNTVLSTNDATKQEDANKRTSHACKRFWGSGSTTSREAPRYYVECANVTPLQIRTRAHRPLARHLEFQTLGICNGGSGPFVVASGLHSRVIDASVFWLYTIHGFDVAGYHVWSD